MKEPKVIFEDKALIVIDKPSGLSVHADGRHERDTLVEWLLQKFPDIAGVGEPQTLVNGVTIDRPGIVHRIDRETSGVLIVARTAESFAFLKEQFQNREVKKTYRAFVYGPLKEERGVIDKPIGSARGGKAPRSASRPHGVVRDAVTVYRRIMGTKEASYIEAFPKTGRTHQIRVHFSAIGHPIVSDTLYAPNSQSILGFKRLALHAHSIAFKHPNGKDMSFTAALPPDFLAAEAELQKQ
jgi:23S rRNA pseudouridine1911/1915/1917 synthase